MYYLRARTTATSFSTVNRQACGQRTERERERRCMQMRDEDVVTTRWRTHAAAAAAVHSLQAR